MFLKEILMIFICTSNSPASATLHVRLFEVGHDANSTLLYLKTVSL